MIYLTFNISHCFRILSRQKARVSTKNDTDIRKSGPDRANQLDQNLFGTLNRHPHWTVAAGRSGENHHRTHRAEGSSSDRNIREKNRCCCSPWRGMSVASKSRIRVSGGSLETLKKQLTEKLFNPPGIPGDFASTHGRVPICSGCSFRQLAFYHPARIYIEAVESSRNCS